MRDSGIPSSPEASDAATQTDASVTADAGPQADAATETREIAKGVWSLDSDHLAADNGDLAPLKPLLEGAEIGGDRRELAHHRRRACRARAPFAAWSRLRDSGP